MTTATAAIQEEATVATKGDATPERVLKAANDNYVAPATGIRTFKDEPLQRLHARNELWRNDSVMNQRLLEAGERYYKDYYVSNMDPLASFDPTRVFSGNSGGQGMPASQSQAVARADFRKAVKAVPAKYLKVVDRVVLQFQGDLVAIGHEATGSASRHTCRAVATERLSAGLYLLAKHYESPTKT